MSGEVRETFKSLYRKLPFKRQLYELLRKGPPLPPALYQHLHFEGPFDVPIEPGRKFAIYSYSSQVENELFWAGYGRSWEARSLEIWAALCCSRSGLAVDIGANTGVYALAAAALGKEVIAFEPIERMAGRLLRNVALNGFPIRVEQMAVSDRSERLPIYDDLTEHNYSASLEGQGPGAASYEVEACSLDDYLAAHGDPAIAAVKIDVERHEPAVLRGMQRTLTRHRPPMLVEVLDEEIGRLIAQQIEGLGYLVFHIDETEGLIPASALGPIGGHNWNHLICAGDDFDGAKLGRFLA